MLLRIRQLYKIKTQRKKGVTLIEAIISVALLSILMIPISLMLMNSLKTSSKSENVQDASYVAQSILEEIQSYGTITLKNDGSNEYFQLLNGEKVYKTDDNTYIGSFSDDDLPSGYSINVDIEKSGTDNTINNLEKYSDWDYKVTFKSLYYSVYSSVSQASIGTRNISENINLTINEDNTINFDGQDYKLSQELNNKILIYLDSTYSNKVNTLSIDNESSNAITVYVIKSNEENSLNVLATNGQVVIYNDLMEEETSSSDLYEISISVTDENGDEVFSGSVTSSIEFCY